MKAAMESCVGKSVMSGVMGFGMGGLFGMFMASVRSLYHSSSNTIHDEHQQCLNQSTKETS